MSLEIERGEIVHANLTFQTLKKKAKIVVKNIVFSRPYEGELQTIYNIDNTSDRLFLLKRCGGIDESVELKSIEVIKSLGFKVPYFEEDLKKPKKKKK